MEPRTDEERLLQKMQEALDFLRESGLRIDRKALEACKAELQGKWKEPPPAPKPALERICGDVLGEE